MAALLNSLSFAFKNSFLPKYRVKYYDYIVKWWSGIQCNWFVSMDITKILALIRKLFMRTETTKITLFRP